MLKAFNILIVICLANFQLFAQQLLRYDSQEVPSTSIYDIYAINTNRYILAAKNGIIAECDTAGNIKVLKASANAANFLKSEKINDSLIMVVGDNGNIFVFNVLTNDWIEKKLLNFNNKALYNICTDNKSNIYICGGHSKIACGQKAIPNGFILKSKDGAIPGKKYLKELPIWYGM